MRKIILALAALATIGAASFTTTDQASAGYYGHSYGHSYGHRSYYKPYFVKKVYVPVYSNYYYGY